MLSSPAEDATLPSLPKAGVPVPSSGESQPFQTRSKASFPGTPRLIYRFAQYSVPSLDHSRSANRGIACRHASAMDPMMGDGGRLPLEAWFWEMPICTRWWTAATLFTSALVQCQIVTAFQLFYSFRAVFHKSQVRRVHPHGRLGCTR